MVKELPEERHASGMGWIVPVDQTEIGIHDQRHRARCQIVVRIHNPARSTELHKSVANRIRWRRELRQMEHATKMCGQGWIWRWCGVSRLRSQENREGENDENTEAA